MDATVSGVRHVTLVEMEQNMLAQEAVFAQDTNSGTTRTLSLVLPGGYGGTGAGQTVTPLDVPWADSPQGSGGLR